MIRFQLLGTIDLRDEDGRELRPILAQPKRLALLAYLAAAEPAGPHRRDTLLGLFWPELDQEHARKALGQAVHFIRRTLGDTALISRTAEELSLDETTAWVDVRAFRSALEASRVEEALELYRGDLLPSFFVPEAPGFEEWLERERSRLRSRAAKAARVLAEHQEAGQNLTLAVTAARRAVELSDGDERPLRRLMELLDRLGDRAGAVRAYELFARKLATELEVEPAPETVALIDRIRASPPRRPVPIIEPLPPKDLDPSVSRLATALADRYTVEREIGRGGMAIVFSARDRRHDRLVALKTLRPELLPSIGAHRFLREIQIAARLQHPNILPLHDSGEAEGLLYYVMPYIEGESLRHRLDREGQLAIEDSLNIAQQVAQALAYAHSLGVVHRDIKPENILLSGDHALVADFGIARAITAAGGDRLTETGLAVGTAAYMSPEQAAADPRVDGRSDIYSLGCVVYEMLAGQPPFTGPSAQAVVARHTLDPVPSLRTLRKTVSPGVEQALLKALEKNPADRFRTASQFAEALVNPDTTRPSRKISLPRPVRRGAAAALSMAVVAAAWLVVPGKDPPADPVLDTDSMSSVAVLPVDNLSGDSTKAYLAEGLTVDLIEELFRIEGLRVPGSATIARYRGRQPDPAQVGRELGVASIVTGNLREVSGRPRVALQLVNAADGFVRWSGVYDGSNPAAGADIARVLAESLRVRLQPQSRPLVQTGTTDAVAYDLYLRGRHLLGQGTEASLRQGVRALQQAIARDSGYAAAWAALPLAYSLLGQTGDLTELDAEVLGRRALERAIALDSLSGVAFVTRADRRLRDWDYSGAHRDLLRSVELTPGSALNLLLYAQFLNLIALDDSALVVMRRALALDPGSPWLIANYSFRLAEVGLLEDAMAEARRALELDSTQWVAHHALAWVHRRQNQPGKSVQEAQKALRIIGDSVPYTVGPLGYYLGLAGHRGEAERVLAYMERARTEGVENLEMWIAYTRLGLGDSAGALDALERSAAKREFSLSYWLSVGEFEALRGQPRYETLLERLGVAEFRNRRAALSGRSSAAGTG
jgi:eukaryotic-like serine/threonine-protein kinase